MPHGIPVGHVELDRTPFLAMIEKERTTTHCPFVADVEFVFDGGRDAGDERLFTVTTLAFWTIAQRRGPAVM